MRMFGLAADASVVAAAAAPTIHSVDTYVATSIVLATNAADWFYCRRFRRYRRCRNSLCFQ